MRQALSMRVHEEYLRFCCNKRYISPTRGLRQKKKKLAGGVQHCQLTEINVCTHSDTIWRQYKYIYREIFIHTPNTPTWMNNLYIVTIIPISVIQCLNFVANSPFVSASATISAVGTNVILMSPFSALSRTKWWRMSICFERGLYPLCFDKSIAPLLSQ